MKTMKGAGYEPRETDPFSREQTFEVIKTGTAPIVGRMHVLWESMRERGHRWNFPKRQDCPRSKKDYLHFVDEIYQNDAYHSLSIEGYRVTPELIERVRGGNWNPDSSKADRENRDALAARGYWQAFQNREGHRRLSSSEGAKRAAVWSAPPIGTGTENYSSQASPPASSARLHSPDIETSRCFCADRATYRHAPTCCATLCRHYSISRRKRQNLRFAQCSGTGCSATSIPIPTETDAWRAS